MSGRQTAATGTDGATGPRGRNYRWFVVVQYAHWEWSQADEKSRPSSKVHAKEMGTTRSACGLDVSTWTKIWHMPFVSSLDACPACSRAVGGRAAS